MQVARCRPCVLALCTALCLIACASRPNDIRGAVDGEWKFAQDGLVFSRNLEAARLSEVVRVAENRYALTVSPEKSLINPSPWYGFLVQADRPAVVTLEISYEDAGHRYWPQLSHDAGASWQPAEPGDVEITDGRLHLRLAVDEHPVRVFAQPPLGPDEVEAWLTRLESEFAIDTRTVGQSINGRPIRALEFGGQDPAVPLLIVTGRQHPPETTGSIALAAFVDALLADDPLATEFRSRVRTIVFPMINPDGVVLGHWRGNAAGDDLNRDWGIFAAPETRAVRDAIAQTVENGLARPVFAVDFHSTYHDVLYTVEEDPSRAPGGLLKLWMDTLIQFYTDLLEEYAYAATSSVFKNWIFNTYGIPAVTYEVSDTTPPGQTRSMAANAAQQLMHLLLQDMGLHRDLRWTSHRLESPAAENAALRHDADHPAAEPIDKLNEAGRKAASGPPDRP